MLSLHKPCWGLSPQSLGSSASQTTVTSGILHWEIMLCDPGGNGRRRSQHWDVSCLLFLFFIIIVFSLFSPLHILSHSLWICPLNVYGWLWTPTTPTLRFTSCFHQPFLLHDPIYYWSQSPPNHPLKLTQSPAQAMGPLPPPQELNYAWWDPARRRIRYSLDRDLHYPL